VQRIANRIGKAQLKEIQWMIRTGKELWLKGIAGRILLPMFSLIVFCGELAGQTFFYQNYFSEVYGAATQNLAVAEGHGGLMYFGNTDGVLEYDGSTWTLIPTPALVRSLDFGVLAPGRKGALQYRSLLDSVRPDQVGFKDVWRILTAGPDVFFATNERLFQLKEGSIQSYAPSGKFGLAFTCRDEVYVEEEGKGLLRLTGDHLELVPGTDFADLPPIRAIFPLGADQIVLCTRGEGLMVFSSTDGRLLEVTTSRFQKVNDLLEGSLPYNGIMLPDGNYAICTLYKGVVIVRPDGEIVNWLTAADGLICDAVLQVHLDRNGQLWMAADKGIAAVAYAPPYQYLTEQNGLNGTIYSVEKHQGDIYVGTSQSCFRIDREGEVHELPGAARENWFLKSTSENLLHAHHPRGFLQSDPDGARTLLNQGKTVGVALSEFPGQPDLLIGATHSGFYILERKTGRWDVRNHITEFDLPIYAANTDREGNMWVRCAPNDLYKVVFSPDLRSVESIRLHEIREHGKPVTTPIPYRLRNGSILFGTDQGVFTYAPARDSFLRYAPMANLRSNVSPIYEDRSGNLWYEESKNGEHVKGVFYRGDNGWRHDSLVLQRFANIEMYKGPTNLMTQTEDGEIVLGTTRGLIVYTPDAERSDKSDYATLIRRVYVNDTLCQVNNAVNVRKSRPLAFAENNVKLEYSALFYEEDEGNTYSHRLLGRDSTWSSFSLENSRQYTNLGPGDYTFEVKARNLYQQESRVATYRFTVLAPWYRTAWAWLGYAVVVVITGFLLYRLGARRQRRKNAELERLIDRRTNQLRKEKERSEELSRNLFQVFTIIGHDLRRPVLAFQGITRKVNFLLKKNDFNRLEKLGANIEREADFLYQLTDNLLQWAVVRQGAKPYRPEPLRVREVVDEATAGVKKLINQKEIKLTLNLQEGDDIYADRVSIVTVYRNLLGNAVKFTPAGGRIMLTSQPGEKQTRVTVFNSGPEISSDVLESIFDPGVRAAASSTTAQPGAGIGLHICRELMLLNRGEISVRNVAGEGVEFVLIVPNQPKNHGNTA